MTTLSRIQSFTVESCYLCGIPFAMTEEYQKEKRTNGGNFHCPNGHSQHYSKPEVTVLREKLDAEQRARLMAETQAQQEREQREAAQRELERTKKRVGAGSCPCCKRHFKALSRHMAAKHPKYKPSEKTAEKPVEKKA